MIDSDLFWLLVAGVAMIHLGVWYKKYGR